MQQNKPIYQTNQEDAYRVAMQSVVNALKVHQPTQQSLQILKSLCLPGEYAWPRVSSAYGSDPTATAKLYRKANVRNGTTALPGDLDNNSTCGFAFRDALRSGFYAFGLAAADTCTYNADFEAFAPLTEDEFFPRYAGPAVLDDLASNISPHGGYLYPGRLGPTDPCRGWLVSQTGSISVNIPPFGGLPPGATVNCSVKRFAATEWIDYASVNFNPGAGLTQSFTANSTGYYCITFDAVLVGPSAGAAALMLGTTTIKQSGALSRMCWAQTALPNLEDVLPQVRAYTVAAVSLMYTNTASPLNRQGQIVGLQLPRNTNPLSFIDFDILASEAKASICDVVNGRYAFLKPTSPSDFDKEVFQYQAAFSTIDNDYVFPLIPKSDYLVIHAQVTDPNGRQGYWTFDHNIEYTSISQWADLRVPTIQPKDFELALMMLAKVPQWHTNALHLSDIWDGIKEVAGKVWSGVKEVASVAAPLLPVAAALL
nr:MAG: hypothetical protein [Chemarfal virus 203]